MVSFKPKQPKSAPKGIIIAAGVGDVIRQKTGLSNLIQSAIEGEARRLEKEIKESFNPPIGGSNVLFPGYRWIKSVEPEVCPFCQQGIKPEDYLEPCQFYGAPAGRR